MYFFHGMTGACPGDGWMEIGSAERCPGVPGGARVMFCDVSVFVYKYTGVTTVVEHLSSVQNKQVCLILFYCSILSQLLNQ